MTQQKLENNWQTFLNFYNDKYRDRPTRLGVFDGTHDYWLENGLLLNGITVETQGKFPTVHISLGDKLTHMVKDAKHLNVHFCFDGSEDGLDFTDLEGKTTILRFEINLME